MKKFKIENTQNNGHIIVVRLIEIEEIGSENFKSIISRDSDPEFVGVIPNSKNHQMFENIKHNNQVINLDLDKDFRYEIKNLNYEYGTKQIKFYLPLNNSIKILIDYDLSSFFNQKNNNYEDDFETECPNCEDIYLEKYDTCEYCGYTRHN